jgi:hypothetical protein
MAVAIEDGVHAREICGAIHARLRELNVSEFAGDAGSSLGNPRQHFEQEVSGQCLSRPGNVTWWSLYDSGLIIDHHTAAWIVEFPDVIFESNDAGPVFVEVCYLGGSEGNASDAPSDNYLGE